MPEGGRLLILTQIIELDSSYCTTSPFKLNPGPYIQIEMQDTGCGIPPDQIDKIFEPFYTTKEQGKGTGLGLSVVYGTIKNYNGAISVYSELGTGTSFHLLLPLSETKCEVRKATPVLQRGEGTILIVDDEEVMRITAKAILEDLGYKVITAENGREALEIYKETTENIDLVVIDMIMPVMNGKDCFLVLQEHDPQVRVVLSSGFTREEDLEAMKTKGLLGFIRKPYRSGRLSQTIYNAMK